MKELILIIFLLVLPFSTHAQEQNNIPKEFLGHWYPYSKVAGPLNIRPDGIIEDIDSKTGQVSDATPYRYIYRSSYRNYIYVVAFPTHTVGPEVWQIESFLNDYSRGATDFKLRIITLPCNWSKKEIATSSNAQLEEILKAQRCGPKGPPYASGISNSGYGRRPQYAIPPH